MRAKKLFLFLGLLVFVYNPRATHAQVSHPPHHHSDGFLKSVTDFSEQGFPEPFSNERLQQLLQYVVDEVYLKGFRYLGDPEDFNHGHILFVSDEPVAILYHTQEHAYYFFNRYGPNAKYAYVNPHGRNWIQWLGSGVVENANSYVRTNYPNTPRWRGFVQHSLPVFQRHFTITPGMLDPEFLGGELTRTTQFFFTRVEFDKLSKKHLVGSNVIEVGLTTGEKVFLALIKDFSLNR